MCIKHLTQSQNRVDAQTVAIIMLLIIYGT